MEAVQGGTLLDSQNLTEAEEENDLRSSRAGRGNTSRPCLRSTTKPKQQKEANLAVALWTSKYSIISTSNSVIHTNW